MNKVVINNPQLLIILGLLRQLKRRQLKELHAAIKLCSPTLVQDNGGCAAFLTNYAKQNVTVHIKNTPLEYVNRSRIVF